MFLPLPVALLLFPLAILSHPTTTTTTNDDDHVSRIPTVREAAVQARELLRSEKLGTLATIFPSDNPRGLSGHPIGMMEYYADCSTNGNPTFLGVKIATSFKNARDGAAISLAVRVHPPKGEFYSPVAHHRVALLGRLGPPIPPNSPEGIRVKKCFTARHPDARWWVPGNPIHESEWLTFEVETVYWVGGFGDREYIGYIPVEMYRNVTLHEGKDEEDAVDTPGVGVQGVWKGLRKIVRIR